MEAQLKEFVKQYSKLYKIPEEEVAFMAGAFSHKIVEQLDSYKQFMLTLNQVAPQLIQLNLILSQANLNDKDQDINSRE